MQHGYACPWRLELLAHNYYEQVVGRALRRQSAELNEDGLFDVGLPMCSASA